MQPYSTVELSNMMTIKAFFTIFFHVKTDGVESMISSKGG